MNIRLTAKRTPLEPEYSLVGAFDLFDVTILISSRPSVLLGQQQSRLLQMQHYYRTRPAPEVDVALIIAR